MGIEKDITSYALSSLAMAMNSYHLNKARVYRCLVLTLDTCIVKLNLSLPPPRLQRPPVFDGGFTPKQKLNYIPSLSLHRVRHALILAQNPVRISVFWYICLQNDRPSTRKVENTTRAVSGDGPTSSGRGLVLNHVTSCCPPVVGAGCR